MRFTIALSLLCLCCNSAQVSEREPADDENCRAYVGKTFFFERAIEQFNKAAAAPDFESAATSDLTRIKGLSHEIEFFDPSIRYGVPVLKVEYETFSPKAGAFNPVQKSMLLCAAFQVEKPRIVDNLDIRKTPYKYFSLDLKISYRSANIQFDFASYKFGESSGLEIIGKVTNPSNVPLKLPQETIKLTFPQGSALLMPQAEGATLVIPARGEESITYESPISDGGSTLRQYFETLLMQILLHSDSSGTKSIERKVQKSLKVVIDKARLDSKSAKFSISAKRMLIFRAS